MCVFPPSRVEQEIEYEYRVELHNRCQREQIREAQAAYYAKPVRLPSRHPPGSFPRRCLSLAARSLRCERPGMPMTRGGRPSPRPQGTRRSEMRKPACEEYSKIFGAGGYYYTA